MLYLNRLAETYQNTKFTVRWELSLVVQEEKNQNQLLIINLWIKRHFEIDLTEYIKFQIQKNVFCSGHRMTHISKG